MGFLKRLRKILMLAGITLALSLQADLRLHLSSPAVALLHDTGGQRVTVWLENRGLERVPVLGGTFHLQVGDGANQGPRITGIEFPDHPDSLFRADNANLTRIEAGPRLWSAIVITEPESLPTEAWIPPLKNIPVVTFVVDTTGITAAASPVSLRMNGTRQGDSVFDQIDPTDRGLVQTLIPEAPEHLLSLVSLVSVPQVAIRVAQGGRIRIELPTTSAKSVRLERTDSLESGRWVPIDLIPESSGGSWIWDLGDPDGDGNTFYRIVAE
jgi:hypothetical protein